jgi:hypothetical protein
MTNVPELVKELRKYPCSADAEHRAADALEELVKENAGLRDMLVTESHAPCAQCAALRRILQVPEGYEAVFKLVKKSRRIG